MYKSPIGRAGAAKRPIFEPIICKAPRVSALPKDKNIFEPFTCIPHTVCGTYLAGRSFLSPPAVGGTYFHYDHC